MVVSPDHLPGLCTHLNTMLETGAFEVDEEIFKRLLALVTKHISPLFGLLINCNLHKIFSRELESGLKKTLGISLESEDIEEFVMKKRRK